MGAPVTRRAFLCASAAAPLGARSNIRWILLDLTGRTLGENWPDENKPVSLGSLLKPFLTLGYLATHTQTPVVYCAGASAGCWFPRGHGRQDVVAALANSCNVYFMELAGRTSRVSLDLTCVTYMLAPPSRSWPPSRLIGLGEGWPQTPRTAARAFASLACNQTDSHVQTVLAGMLRCSRSGTAKGIGFQCYAKTGTAPCSDGHGSGDGYVTAMYPVDDPRRILLLRQHNTTGASAAKSLKPLITSFG